MYPIMMLYFNINMKLITSKLCYKIFFGDNKKINCFFSLQISECKIFLIYISNVLKFFLDIVSTVISFVSVT